MKGKGSVSFDENLTSIVGNEFSSTDEILPAEESKVVPRQGMNFWITASFLVAQMAGAGFLALPAAFASTGWIGLPMLIIFCFSIGFSGTRLGHCWVMLEERWEQYSKPARQPYMEIAFRSFGTIGRQIILIAVLITLVGSTIVYLILMAQFLNSLAPDVSICLFATVIAFAYIPFTWLGTPKDFWQASVLAVAATAFACLVIFIQLAVESSNDSQYLPQDPIYRNPTFSSFSLGFGTILFAFGGASVFPTIQNDMEDRSQFWKSVSISFVCLIIMYLPVAILGYAIFGYVVTDNILLYRPDDVDIAIAVKIAIGFEIVNLLVTFLIAFNAVCLIVEEMFNIPPKFGIYRCSLRAAMIMMELIIALGIPDFGLILNLVGGSTVTLCSFLMPPLMYMKLVDDHSDKSWPVRTIPKWERIFLWEIVAVGVVGGICSTGSAINGIINSSFDDSCFSNYKQEGI